MSGSKNSAKAVGALRREEESRKAGLREATTDFKSLLFNFAWWMKKQGYADSTIESRVKLLRVLAKRGADLYDPESVKDVIARQNWSNKRKINAVDAYTKLLEMTGGTWDPPRYSFTRTLPFIPLESELDQLIAGCGRRVSAFLQLLKETGMRAGEAWRLKWSDVDFETRTVRVTPEKGSSPRIFKLSNKLIAMLNGLPRESERIFGYKAVSHIRRTFERQRKRLAHKLGNPRLKRITFHTFRHWKATMLYHQTKDILYVMNFLGHKNIKNTLIYIQLEEALFKERDDEFICKAAKTVKEAMDLVEQGFEYVCTVDGVKLFRKRK